LLEFWGVYANSLDGAIATLQLNSCAASLIMVHLSRLSEEVILWSSEEFSFVKLKDSCATGSSIIKRKTDVPELVRGKTGEYVVICRHC